MWFRPIGSMAALCASDFVLTTGESEWMRGVEFAKWLFPKRIEALAARHDHVGNTVIRADLIPASSRSIVSFAPNTLADWSILLPPLHKLPMRRSQP